MSRISGTFHIHDRNGAVVKIQFKGMPTFPNGTELNIIWLEPHNVCMELRGIVIEKYEYSMNSLRILCNSTEYLGPIQRRILLDIESTLTEVTAKGFMDFEGTV